MPKDSVLVISNLYPPVITGGVLRTEKIVRGFSEICSIRALTISNYHDSGLVVDKAFTGPDIEVNRTYSPDLYVALNLVTRLLKRTKTMAKESSLRFKGLSKWHYWFTPDPYLPWMLTAFPKGFGIARDQKTKLIFSAYPSPVNILIGYMLKKLTGKFYYIDFQDPGFTAPKGVRDAMPTKLHLYLNLFLEGKALGSADLITVVSEEMKLDLLNTHKNVKEETVLVLPQIIDTEKSKSIPAKKQGKFTITFTGAIGPYQDIKKLVVAANSLISSGKIKKGELQFLIAGSKNEKMLEEAKALDKAGVLNYVGTVPYEESISLMKGSDVLYVSLAFNDDLVCALPTKTFEYMAAGKPLLAFAPKGELTKLIKEKKVGLAVEKDDSQELANALFKLYSGKKLREELSSNCLKAAKEFDYRVVVKEKVLSWINSKAIQPIGAN
jgi:glycosyltransferase involved in cell wall biosynthesis